MIKTKSSLQIEDKGTIKAKRVLNIASDLSWNYGEDVIVYDVRTKSPFISYYIVCSASNDHRLQSLVSVAEESLYDNFFVLSHKEGRNGSTWILLDAKEVVVQLFTKSMREEVKFDDLYLDCPHKRVETLEEPDYPKRKRA